MFRPTRDRIRRAAAGVAALLLVCVGLAGCGTYATESARIKAAVAGGDVERALGEVGEVDDDDVLGLLQRGLLLFYAGRNVEAARTFDRAYQRIDFLYGTDYVKEALSFLTNDAQRDYVGYPAEQVLLNTYGSLAYMAEGDLDKALVMARRANTLLTRLADVREDAEGYTDDAFAEWLAAMLYAEDGDANPCMVAARRALASFREYEALWGQRVPSAFVQDYVVWARRFGFDDEADALVEEFGDVARLARPPRRDEGEVVVIYESGFVSHLEEARLEWPILERDDDGGEDLARRIYRRGPRHTFVVHDDVRVKYWLSVAMPVLARTEPRLVEARLRAGDLAAFTEPVHDVSSIFELTFQEGAATRTIRTIVRALTKYQITQAVREGKKKDDGTRETNEVAGFLANLFASATERADTRSWTTLPDTIHLARLRLPEGRHRLVLEVLDRSGKVAQTATYDDVVVVAGERTILHHRTYE